MNKFCDLLSNIWLPNREKSEEVAILALQNRSWKALTSLDISDIDTIWTYFSESFCPSYIKLTNYNPNKDFESVGRP